MDKYSKEHDDNEKPDRRDSLLSLDITALTRIAERIPPAAYFIIINEFCERFAYYGSSIVFQNYIQFPRPDPSIPRDSEDFQNGALGRGQATATALNQFFTFLAYFTPLLGAIISDQYLGKFKTIIIFSTIYMIGLSVLTATSTQSSLDAGYGFPGLIAAMIIIGFGTGGIKSIVSPMAADQFKHQEPVVKVIKGEHVVVDPDLSIQHMYNWFYWAINVGALIGGILTPKLEHLIDYWIAYLVPTLMFVVSLIVFISGKNLYVRVPPAGSIVLKAWRCYRGGLKPQQVTLPDGSIDQSLSWDDKFIVELKQTGMACKVFLPMTIYWVAYSQIFTNLISQAAIMDRPASIPNDIMGNLDPFALILFIPIMDYFIFPWLARVGVEFYAIRRITVGFFIAAIAMVWSAGVQYAIEHNPEKSVSVWWQTPSYVLIALSEIFASIASIEYSYSHAPASMKSLISAVSLFPNALAAIIGILMAPLSQDQYIFMMYIIVAVATTITGIGFWFMFRHYDDLDQQIKFSKRNDTSNVVMNSDLKEKAGNV